MSLARHVDFSLYENSLKTNVEMLSADFPYGEKFLRYGEIFLAVPALFNEKYPKMHEAANHKLSNFLTRKRKF
jgi:hypothetical protein